MGMQWCPSAPESPRKGGKEHELPVHHLLEQILNEYIEVADLQSGQPLFQSVNSAGTAVSGRALNRYNAWAAIRKRGQGGRLSQFPVSFWLSAISAAILR
jgi:hypothetical protein